MSKEKIQKIVLMVLVFCGVCYGVYEYYLSISNEKIQMLSEEYKEKYERTKKFEVWSKQKDQAKKMIVEYENQIKELDKIVPSKNESSNFTMEIYKMIKDGNIKADNVDMSFPQGNEKCNITRFSIQLSGTLDEIKAAVNYFKGFDKKLMIKNFNVQANPANYSAKIDIDLYSMKE